MILSLITFLLVTVCAVISLVSLVSSPWSTFKADSETYTNGLFKSLKAPDTYQQADYTCLKILSCADSTDSDLCKISQKLYLARNYYIGFEISAVIIMILLSERLLLKAFNRPCGSPKFFLFLAWVFPVVKSSGILIFMLLSNISLENINKVNEITSEYGVYLAFTTLGLSIVCSAMIVIGKLHHSSRMAKNEITMSTSRFIKSAFILLISQVLLIISGIYPTASFNEFSKIILNVQYVKEINGLTGLSFACVAGQECQIASKTCTIFKDLESIASTCSVLEGIGYFFLMLWIEAVVHLLLKIRLGTNMLNYSYPVLYVIFNFIGFIYYLAKGHISFGADCNIESFKDSYALCAELGTTFYIIGVIFTVLSLITYELVLMISIVSSGPSLDRKIQIEPDNEKQHSKEVRVTDLDKSADKTSSEMKPTKTEEILNVSELDNSSIINQKFCDRCKQAFKPREQVITEGKQKLHYSCFILPSK